ncbi:MAG: DUF2149 domain-containing protein [Planctomycetota bacterium]
MPRFPGNDPLREPAAFFEEGEDPLAALPNLFDVAIVFALALVVALATALRVPMASLQAVPEKARPVPLHEGRRTSAGPGARVGIVFRLSSGELVYVPDPDSPKPPR